MSMSELFRDLDPKIAGPLEKVTEALKAEISSQIDGVRKDVQSLVGSGAAAGELDPLEELKLAAAGIDRATRQSAILTQLLEGAGRFSSRAAFVLVRDDGQKCWGSLGFENAGRPLEGEPVAAPNGDSAWAQVSAGAGTRALTAEECASFCSQFDAPTPVVGALLPLSLGDHVAGYLYVDRVGDGHLNLSALQLLTFVAGQALETLPVRKRTSTPTLTVAAAGAVAAAPMAASEPEPVAAEPEPEPVPEAVLAEPAISEPEPETEPETLAAEPEPEPEALVTEPEVAEPEPVSTETPTEELESLADPDALDAASVGFQTEVVPVIDDAAEGVDAVVAEAQPEVEAELETPEAETPSASFEATSAPATTEPDVAQEPEPEPEPEPPPTAVAPPPAAPAPPAEAASTQVVPPDDVRGPGWAFTASEPGGDAGNEALHEEARRLARLLVTEIKLYNEEQVEQGRRGGDIYRRLQEDIDRSRQIFEDRIDPQIRAENDYFKEALVRILAGGDESLLGM